MQLHSLFFHNIKKFAQIFSHNPIDCEGQSIYFAPQIEPGSLET